MEVGNVTKVATLKSFFDLSYKNTQLLFFVTVLFNIFMRQTLADDFRTLHNSMNCAFSLRSISVNCRKSQLMKTETLIGQIKKLTILCITYQPEYVSILTVICNSLFGYNFNLQILQCCKNLTRGKITRSSHWWLLLVKKAVLRIFAIFTGKHL